MTKKDEPMIHIDLSDKDPAIPEMGSADRCGRDDCPGPDGYETGFGLAGGGYGVYEFCDVCGQIVSKSEVNDA